VSDLDEPVQPERNTPSADPVSADGFFRDIELSGGEFGQLVECATARLVSFLESLPDQPARDTENIEPVLRLVDEPLPSEAVSANEILNLLFEDLIPKSFNTTSPGYLSFIPSGGLPQSAVADLIAGTVNRYVGVWQAAPALAQLEATVVRWICDIVGFPASAGGFLTTGGSLANWSAIVTARRCRLPEDFLKGIIYTSSQTHHSVAKAAMLAGFPERNVRVISCDERFRINCHELREAVENDRSEGLTPFLIVGNAGTTNTGAVDDLEALADLAAAEQLWLHLDATYGGFFTLTERGQAILKGMSRADSIALDPHKGLFLPFGNGALVVRDAKALSDTHRLDADYMPAMQQAEARVDFCNISPELSRDFRGLRLWLPIKLHGIDAFRRALDEKLDLIAMATAELKTIDGIEIVAEPQLTTVAFRLNRPGLDEADLNQLNREFLDRINADKRIMLTSTILDGRFVLRICVLSFRTHAKNIDDCMEAIRTAAVD
jgi:aromatic-L-amino-acid/L-tryptophan decarboxylase